MVSGGDWSREIPVLKCEKLNVSRMNLHLSFLRFPIVRVHAEPT